MVTTDEVMVLLPQGVFTLRDRVAQVLAIVQDSPKETTELCGYEREHVLWALRQPMRTTSLGQAQDMERATINAPTHNHAVALLALYDACRLANVFTAELRRRGVAVYLARFDYVPKEVEYDFHTAAVIVKWSVEVVVCEVGRYGKPFVHDVGTFRSLFRRLMELPEDAMPNAILKELAQQ